MVTIGIDPLFILIIGGLAVAFYWIYSKGKIKNVRPDMVGRMEDRLLLSAENNPNINFDWLYHGKKKIGKIYSEKYFKRNSEKGRIFIQAGVKRKSILGIIWFSKAIYDIPWDMITKNPERKLIVPSMSAIDPVKKKAFWVYSTDPESSASHLGGIYDNANQVLLSEAMNTMGQEMIDFSVVEKESGFDVRKKREELELMEAQKRGLLAKA